MGYYQGESVLDCTYCEEDVLNTAKSNIRSFLETILGLVLLPIILVLGILIGTISCIGGCFGCEACLESAECVDNMYSQVRPHLDNNPCLSPFLVFLLSSAFHASTRQHQHAPCARITRITHACTRKGIRHKP